LAAFDVAEDIIQHTETTAASGNDVMNSRLHPCKQTWFSAAGRLAPTCSWVGRRLERLAGLEMSQVFVAGPDDEQVEAPTFLRGVGDRYA
jgi:hypothetical protein